MRCEAQCDSTKAPLAYVTVRGQSCCIVYVPAKLSYDSVHVPAVYLHHLPQLLRQVGLQADIAAPTLQHCAASAVTLVLPGALAVGVHWASPLADLGMRASGVRLAQAFSKKKSLTGTSLQGLLQQAGSVDGARMAGDRVK